jgi:porin
MKIEANGALRIRARAIASIAGIVMGTIAGSAAAQAPAAADKYIPPDLLDGSLSVLGDLMEDEAPQTSFFRRPTAFEPWFAWKQRLREETGLNFGGSWGVLWQNFSTSAIDQRNAFGSKLTLNFSYDLLNRGARNALSLDVAVEDRRALGPELPPLQAGIGAGSIVPTAATWGQFDLGVTQAYLRQNLFDNHFQYSVGKVFAPNFIDAYPFFDDNRQFLSQQFSTSPTIASPLRGFGAVAAWYPTDSGLYLKPGVFTNHSSDTGSTISDFFDKNERFYMFEAGFSSLAQSGVPIQARGPMDANNIHLTGWYREPEENGMQRAYGVAFNANYMYGDNTMWFLRAGWSDGWVNDRAVSAGLGWRPPDATSDLFGFGVGWTRPSSSFLESQYTGEIFYRFNITPNFAITPDLEYIAHPSLNPGVDQIWVFSLRGRIVF